MAKKIIFLIIAGFIAFAIVSNSFGVYAPIHGTIAQIQQKKTAFLQQFDQLLGKLPGSFDDALNSIRDASTDRQWIGAEIGQMARKLFDQLCATNITADSLREKLQNLRARVPQIADIVPAIENKCKLLIAQNQAGKLPIDAITKEWTDLVQKAQTQQTRVEQTKKEAKLSTDQLRTAVAAGNLPEAMAAHKRMDNWQQAFQKLQDRTKLITDKMAQPDWTNAVQQANPAIMNLQKSTQTLSGYITKTAAYLTDIAKSMAEVKAKAEMAARVAKQAVKDAENAEKTRQENFQKDLAATQDDDTRKEMNKLEVQDHVKAMKAINKLKDDADQWRMLAGKEPLK